MKRAPAGVVLAGGGTAGHVYPGIELAKRLTEIGCDGERIVFTGTERGTGIEIVRSAGFRFIPMRISGLSRRHLLRNFKVLGEFAVSLFRSVQLLRRERPSVVVGLGGYSSLPVLIAATLLGVPRTILQEDAILGISNRMAAWTCREIALAFPAPSDMFGSRGKRVRPAVRSAIAELASRRDPVRARKDLGLSPDSKVLLFVGGSLGAAPINEIALKAVERWSRRSDTSILHVTGVRFYEECCKKLDELSRQFTVENYILIEFEPNFERLLEAATLAITRGGATTIGELAVSGTPAVVVPSSFVVANHQEFNARALEHAGGCEVVLDSEISKLLDVVESLLASEEKLDRMRKAGPEACKAEMDFFDVVASVGGLN